MTAQVTPRFKAPKNPNKPRPKTARERREGMSDKYLAKIRKLPSCISWLWPVEAHHLRVKQERGVGMRATDKWSLPLTAEEHRAVHRVGSRRESEWFKKRGINCYELAAGLWLNRHDLQAMYRVLLAHYHDPRRPRVSHAGCETGRADPVVRSRRCVSAESTADGK